MFPPWWGHTLWVDPRGTGPRDLPGAKPRRPPAFTRKPGVALVRCGQSEGGVGWLSGVTPASSGTQRRTGAGGREHAVHSQEPTSCPLNGSSETDSPTRPAVIGKLAAASQDEPHPATKKQVAREDSSTPQEHTCAGQCVGSAAVGSQRLGQTRPRDDPRLACGGPRLWSGRQHNLTTRACPLSPSGPLSSSWGPVPPPGGCLCPRDQRAGSRRQQQPPPPSVPWLSAAGPPVGFCRAVQSPPGPSLWVPVHEGPAGQPTQHRGTAGHHPAAPHGWVRGHRGLGEHGGRRETPQWALKGSGPPSALRPSL